MHTKMAHRIFIIISCLIGVAISVPLNSRNATLKIAGGEPADIRDFPYQVVVLPGIYLCGGSILNERYILSAAHCIFDVNVSDIIVRAGSSHRDSGGVQYRVEAAFQHEAFNSETFDNDIVILKLEKDLEFNGNITPIPVAPAGFTIEDNKLATVTGYGLTGPDGPFAESLQKVELPLISTKSCQQIYGAEKITDRMFCAGYAAGVKDSCPGDSGSPMVLDGQVIGIVSFGPDCAAPKSPGIYTKVSEFRSFIDSVITNL